MALTGNGNGRDRYATGDDSGDVARRKFAAQCGLDEDDPMLPLLQANAQLETKVEQWSTAILELAALARQQNQAMQETSQNSLRLASALNSSGQESQQLQQLIANLGSSLAALKHAVGSKPSPELNQSALQTLMPMLKSIQAEIGDIQLQIDNVRDDQLNGSGNVWTRSYWGWFFFAAQVGGTLAIALLFSIHNGRLQATQEIMQSQSSWQLTKLERIEKALGIDPKKD